MSTAIVTFVLHGATRPSAPVLSALQAACRAACAAHGVDEVEFADAFDDGGEPRGAAARVGEGLRMCRDVVVCLAVTREGRTAPVPPLLDAVFSRRCLAIADRTSQLRHWVAAGATADLVGTIASTVERVFAGDTAPALAAFTSAWAAPKAIVQDAGGLDARWLHVGDVLDLALRAVEHGHAVECLAIDGLPASDVYPLDADVAEFLGWRHAAGIALARPSVTTAGRLTAWVAAAALARAWQRAGLDPAGLRLGGRWAQQAAQDRWLGRAGVRRNDLFWPKDEAGTALPFLALDAAVEDLLARGSTPSTASDSRVAELASDDDAAAATHAAGNSTIANDGSDTGGANATRAMSPAGIDGASPGTPPIAGAARTLPFVSVIVVNWNGAEHLEPCFSSLRESDYPADRLELICVDNGSTDGSRELLASRLPFVKVVALDENLGFTGGNLAGVDAARGDVLAFFNNDMRIAPGAIRRLVEDIDEAHPCVAARVLSWDGQRIDFVRGTLSFEARGYQEYYGEPLRTELATTGESFFPNGGAFAITREAYERAGGFDAAYFAYYEDTDLGWGVRLNGGRVRIVPDAIAYHRHSATSNRWPRGQKLFLMERNAIWTASKRYGERTLARTLGPMLLLAARRVSQDLAVSTSSSLTRALLPFSARLRGRRGPVAWRYDDAAQDSSAGTPRTSAGFLVRVQLESVAALGEAVRGFDRVATQRRAIQSARVAADRDVLPQFGRPMECLSGRKTYRVAQEALVDRFGLESLFRPRTRVLIITHDPLRANMSGPGVRVLEMGRALAATCDVTIATPFEPELRDDRCRVAQYSLKHQDSMDPLAESADVVVVQGFTLSRYPVLTQVPAQVVVDLYCPFTIEHLEMRTSARHHSPGSPAALPVSEIHAEATGILDVQNTQLQLGDFFICASERQRDFWIGALQTAGRINTLTYGDDPSLRSLIDVVPFGLPDEAPPAKSRAVIKGVLPNIAKDDFVILWAGSLLDWQDPQGLVRAVARLSRTHPRAKLVFMGTRHPNPDVPLQRAVEESIAVAREAGVLDRHVFFNTWVPYAERHEWLLEADLGVSTHRDHTETRFAYRTRMLDYIWAGLPVVCTRGDVFADLVDQDALGLTVPPGDEDALAAALARLMDDEEARQRAAANLRSLAGRMQWSRVVDPLRRFCLAPRYAPDRAPGKQAFRRRLEGKFRVSKWMKQTALRVGVSEGRIEQVKQMELVRKALIWRNRVALSRAFRGK